MDIPDDMKKEIIEFLKEEEGLKKLQLKFAPPDEPASCAPLYLIITNPLPPAPPVPEPILYLPRPPPPLPVLAVPAVPEPPLAPK